MAEVETIELQLLETIIPAGSEGRTFDLSSLYGELKRTNGSLRNMALNLANELMIASLVDLVEKECIRIRHYAEGESIRRKGSETIELFYRGSFSCTRLFPGAFTQRDALVGKSRRGIFISHNVPESKLPIALKAFLQLALPPDYPIFVSSDFQSIQAGKPWFAEIVTAIQTSAAVLVIVTPESVNQRWLNFEAGIGIGCGIPVMPLLTRGFDKSSFLPPLNQLQAREMANKMDFDGMIADFREVVGCKWDVAVAETLFLDLQRICRELDEVGNTSMHQTGV